MKYMEKMDQSQISIYELIQLEDKNIYINQIIFIGSAYSVL